MSSHLKIDSYDNWEIRPSEADVSEELSFVVEKDCSHADDQPQEDCEWCMLHIAFMSLIEESREREQKRKQKRERERNEQLSLELEQGISKLSQTDTKRRRTELELLNAQSARYSRWHRFH